MFEPERNSIDFTIVYTILAESILFISKYPSTNAARIQHVVEQELKFSYPRIPMSFEFAVGVELPVYRVRSSLILSGELVFFDNGGLLLSLLL